MILAQRHSGGYLRKSSSVTFPFPPAARLVWFEGNPPAFSFRFGDMSTSRTDAGSAAQARIGEETWFAGLDVGSERRRFAPGSHLDLNIRGKCHGDIKRRCLEGE